MNWLIYFFCFLILINFTNYFFKFVKIFNNYKGESHQKIDNYKYIPLTGGLYLIVFFSIFFYEIYFFKIIFFILIFFIGLLSDFKVINDPLKRITLQTLIIFFFIYFADLNLSNTRLAFLDYLLNNKIFSYFFLSFCILIVINGTNFIDGINSNTIIYFILVTIFLIISKLNNIPTFLFFYLLIFLICLLILNFYNQLYLGDSGSYLLGFIFSTFLISIYQSNQNISPFFVILLLWYPCYENLFSIIRKKFLKKNPIKPDTIHFHHLLHNFLKKKFNFHKLIKKNAAGFVINFYNLIVFNVGCQNINNTRLQIFLILLNIILYNYLYMKLKKINTIF